MKMSNIKPVHTTLGITNERVEELYGKLYEIMKDDRFTCSADILIELRRQYETGEINLNELIWMVWMFGGEE